MGRAKLISIGLVAMLVGCVLQVPAQNTTQSSNPGSNPGAVQALSGPVVGQVLDEQGKPAANVKVTAFLAGSSPLSNTSPLAGNGGALAGNGGALAGNGGALAGNGGALGSGGSSNYRTMRAVLATDLSTTTDAQGRYSLSPSQAGKYNLLAESKASDTSKAYKGSVDYKGGSDQAKVDAMHLAPTGSIHGHVRFSLDSVKQFNNTFVFIPGLGYQAITGSSGEFTIPNVPVGNFELSAFNVDLGEAHIPNADNPGLISVQSNSTTEASTLVMVVNPPVLTGVFRTGTQDPTDNGYPGTAIDLQGQYFGAARGTRWQVLFNGAPATTLTRKSDNLITATVPDGAADGQVLVQVGGLNSNPLSFRVIKSLSLRCPDSGDSYSPGSTIDFAKRLNASDTEGAPIVAVPDGNPPHYGPNVGWSVDSNFASINKDGLASIVGVPPAGQLAPNVVLSVGSGAYTRCSVPIAGTSPNPSPSPTTSPAPGPSPSPSPTPTVSPTNSPKATDVQVTAGSSTILMPGVGAGSDVLPTSTQLSAVVTMSDGSTNGDVVWSNANPTVVALDSSSGVVSALSPGQATLYATSKDGRATGQIKVDVAFGSRAVIIAQ